jgi:hypothetical protein
MASTTVAAVIMTVVVVMVVCQSTDGVSIAFAPTDSRPVNSVTNLVQYLVEKISQQNQKVRCIIVIW